MTYARESVCETSPEAGAAASGTRCTTELTRPERELIWSRIRRKLRAELGEDIVASWFTSVEFSGLEGPAAHISVPTRFLKSWIDAHFIERLTRHFAAECGASRVIVALRGGNRTAAETAGARATRPIVSDAASQTGRGGVAFLADAGSRTEAGDAAFAAPFSGQHAGQTSATIIPMAAQASAQGGSPLDPRYTLDRFVSGKANEFALAAARRVTDGVGGPCAVYNPLFVHAAVGLGKTHLIQGVAQASLAAGRRAVYLTADRFMHGFVAALRSQTAITFKDRLRDIDALIIDDVQFLQGKTIQQEFGHIINALVDAGRQVIVAADRPPSELDMLDERVRSRLSAGLLVEITAPDEDLRRRVLEARIAAATEADPTFAVGPHVIALVAGAVSTNLRDIEGAVNRLRAHVMLTGQPINVETAEVAIRDLLRNREPRRVKIEEILKMVSGHYNITRADILSSRRTASVVKPRQIAMYLSKTLTLRSLPEIGRRFGGRDHTTVLHAVRKIDGLVVKDDLIRQEIELLRRMLTE